MADMHMQERGEEQVSVIPTGSAPFGVPSPQGGNCSVAHGITTGELISNPCPLFYLHLPPQSPVTSIATHAVPYPSPPASQPLLPLSHLTWYTANMAARLASRPPRQLPRSSSDAPFPYQLRTMLAARPSPEASRATRSSAYCGGRGRSERRQGGKSQTPSEGIEGTEELRRGEREKQGGREGPEERREG